MKDESHHFQGLLHCTSTLLNALMGGVWNLTDISLLFPLMQGNAGGMLPCKMAFIEFIFYFYGSVLNSSYVSRL